MPDVKPRVRRIVRLMCFAVASLGALAASGEGIQHARANSVLRTRLASWNLPRNQRERVIAIRDHVRASINHDGLRVTDPRPFLRATAAETLATGKGFCGESSRVMIRMLGVDGIEARRVYMWASPTNQHVAVEAIVDGQPLMLEPLSEGTSETEPAAYFHAEGMTQRSYWSFRLLGMIGVDPFEDGGTFATLPPPHALTVITESPHLILAFLSGAVSLLALYGAWLARLSPVSSATSAGDSANIDERTVAGFGREWRHFDQAALPETELQSYFDRYFAIFPWDALSATAEGFDLGCGSGRWAKLVAPRVRRLHCIDASESAVDVARANLANGSNCEFHLASVDRIPLPDGSMDFGYALGVLHHVPDTVGALTSCIAKLKPGAPFLVYLYYAFDNRPAWFRLLWRASDPGRRLLSRMPFPFRLVVTHGIAAFVYWPLARTARVLERMGRDVSLVPLSFYRDSSFYTMRTDALDRFGTHVEHRFTSAQIAAMLTRAGLREIRFSPAAPFWCAVGIKSAVVAR